MSAGSISVVVPTYNVAAYLPEFLQSLDLQTGDLSAVEIIFVNDGSTDDSADRIRRWQATTTLTTRLVEQDNGGLSAARNAGLDVATGEWVCFCDPDDVLTPPYLDVMSQFVKSDKAATTHLVAGNFVYLNEETNTRSNTHPLRFRFSEGNRVMDLERHPHFIHVAANTGLFRRKILQKYGLRYDSRVEPVWEDGHLTCLYLAKFERPRIAMMADAVYLYRRRTDGSSLMQGSWVKLGKYLSVPRYGWLDALRRIDAERGGVPLWIQNIILYDLTGYFRQELRSPSPTGGIPQDITEAFYAILDDVMPYIDGYAIEAYRVSYIELEVRQALLLGLKKMYPRPSEIAIDDLDKDRGLIRLHYYFTGELPEEEFRARGLRVRPVYEKIRSCRFLGRTLMSERTVWLPADGGVQASIDGVPVPLRIGPMVPAPYLVGPGAIWPQLAGTDRLPASAGATPRGLRPRAGKVKRRVRGVAKKYDLRDPRQRLRAEDKATVKLARAPLAKRRYRGAWLLIDRDTQAQDNAEHFYRYLRAHQPQINAWFVLDRSSSDWDRLEREGFRLIEHGTREHRIALLNCAHLLSSQIDNYITNPLHAYRYGKNAAKWHYTFLQHGVTKDDLSIWINPKPISLMITATPDEHNMIVGDGSTYAYSDREIKLTGFPRHDRLLTLARTATERPHRVLIMPTWRRDLVLGSGSIGNQRRLRHDFWTSEYARQWRAVIESENLHRLAAEKGWEVVFIPHPNMQDYLDESPLPPHIKVFRFNEIDIQEMLASATVLVTDYSSMGFEMAYIERPVVYFQFDQESFFNGTHAYRRGTWSYEKDGFGPVTLDSESAVRAIGEIIERGGQPEPEYADRIHQTFAFRDGRCSERTFQAVKNITRRLKYNESYLRLESARTLEGVPVDGE